MSRGRRSNNSNASRDWSGYLILLAVITVTIVFVPESIADSAGKVTVGVVWYCGWITAVSTGLGVLPFFFVSNPNSYWMGISNAIAGGMMIAASYSLFVEGLEANDVPGFYGYHAGFRTVSGFLLGVIFIVLTKRVLDQYEGLKIGSVEGSRILLIMFVMTLHSVSEGIGIGVAFGGERGTHLGKFISLSLAMHNIPEGLAVALVLSSRRVSRLRTALWCIFTSIPQPFMAIPAFLFIEHFTPMLPAGLGFAAGAMIFVAFFELLAEAVQETSLTQTATVSTASFLLMIYAQESVKISTM
mmetsp:Transcript_10552/g.16019  ORF Transcript_10552/g.16019 Transcript_10552/m.16019 type:complete len:300 (-) Transcript_10552:243-1142(-)